LQRLKTAIKKNGWFFLLAATLIGSLYILLSDNKQLPQHQDTTLIQKIKDHDKAVRSALEEHGRLVDRVNELRLELQNLGKKK
jgi:hypothetical protein